MVHYSNSAINKLSVDVLSTRQHWYPKWVLFKVSPYESDLVLVRRQALGQVITDTAIQTGAAIPIPRNKQAVCDAMHLIHHQFPELVHQFHLLLLSNPHDSRGWFPFAKHAVKRFARWNSEGDDAAEDFAIELWCIWYAYNVRRTQSSAPGSGCIFFRALVDSENFVRRSIQLYLYYHQ